MFGAVWAFPERPRASLHTIRLRWHAEALPALALQMGRTTAVVGTYGNGRFPSAAAIYAERAERSVNIGHDSLPGLWNLVSPSAQNPGNPIKPGGLTDSCSEPSFQVPHPAHPGAAIRDVAESPL